MLEHKSHAQLYNFERFIKTSITKYYDFYIHSNFATKLELQKYCFCSYSFTRTRLDI